MKDISVGYNRLNNEIEIYNPKFHITASLTETKLIRLAEAYCKRYKINFFDVMSIDVDFLVNYFGSAKFFLIKYQKQTA